MADIFRGKFGRVIDDARDAVGDQALQNLREFLFVRLIDRNHVVVPLCLLDHRAHDLQIVRVGQIGHDDGDAVAFAADQPRSDFVGNIAQLVDYLPDFPARRIGHVSSFRYNARHRHRRNAGALRHFFPGHHCLIRLVCLREHTFLSYYITRTALCQYLFKKNMKKFFAVSAPFSQ